MRYWIVFSALLSTGLGCGFPGAPAHSTVSLSDEVISAGTIATYSCDRGFELLGPARKICSDNGTWSPPGIPFCVLNVAAGKAPMQSSVQDGGIPQKAVDGSTASSFNPETCTVTEHERNPWWYVNLLEPYMVQLVRIDFGQSCCGDRPVILEVRVGNNRPDIAVNPICNRFEGRLEEGRPLFLPCSPPMPGAFVSVHFVEPLGVQLSICETFVYTDQALPIERCPSFRDQVLGNTATYNGKCYLFYHDTPKNFDEAFDFCKQRGGSLIDETNPALQGFLSWELWRRHRGDPNGQYWFGAVRDPNDGNNWKWINGRDVTISFWNLPGGHENCARFDGAKGWLWSDTNCLTRIYFVCQHRPKTCGKPEQPPNSTMMALSFDVGAEILYSCDPGHVLVGPSVRQCLNSGFFNEFPPNCQYIQCGKAAPIRYGSYSYLNGTSNYMSMIRYSCEPGYGIVGRPDLMCDVDGRWNGPPPRCEAITCDAVPTIENGFSSLKSSPIEYGQSVRYSCNAGYRLVGQSVLHCTEFGSLSDVEPTCEAEDLLNQGFGHVDLQDLSGNTVDGPYRDRGDPMDSSGADSIPPYVTILPSYEGERSGNVVSFEKERGPSISRPGYTQESDGVTRANIPLGGIIALGVFGGFVFLAAIVTTIVILVRRSQGSSSKKYVRRHDDVTTSSDTSSTDGHGLNKFYKRAWDNLGGSSGIPPLSRDTEKGHVGPRPRVPDGGEFRSGRSMAHEGLRDGSEMTVNDVTPMYNNRPDKKRHHHHHHRHDRLDKNRECRDRDRRKY